MAEEKSYDPYETHYGSPNTPPPNPRSCKNPESGATVSPGTKFTTGKGGDCRSSVESFLFPHPSFVIRCKCDNSGALSCGGCSVLKCPAGEKLFVDPDKCCVQKCVEEGL